LTSESSKTEWVSQEKPKNLLGLKKTLILVLVSLSLAMGRSEGRSPAQPPAKVQAEINTVTAFI
jgi:hypothetical protein